MGQSFSRRTRYFVRGLLFDSMRMTDGGIVSPRARDTLYYYPSPRENWFACTVFAYEGENGQGKIRPLLESVDFFVEGIPGNQEYLPSDGERAKTAEAFLQYCRDRQLR